MEHVRYKVNGRRAFRVVVRERQAELEDRIRVITLMNEENTVPNEQIAGGRDDIDAQGAMSRVTERGIFKGNCGPSKDVFVSLTVRV